MTFEFPSYAPPVVGARQAAPLTLLRQLQQHTRPLHRQLDGLTRIRALLDPALQLPQYLQIMTIHAAAYAPLEAAIARLEVAYGPGPLPPYAPRLPALVRDLRRLRSVSRPVPEPPDAPEAVRLGHMHSSPHYLGLRYVLEGATQGSRVIAPLLRANLPQIVPEAFDFWRGQRVLAMGWPAFCKALERTALRAEGQRQVLEGASCAFLTFIAGFTGPRPIDA